MVRGRVKVLWTEGGSFVVVVKDCGEAVKKDPQVGWVEGQTWSEPGNHKRFCWDKLFSWDKSFSGCIFLINYGETWRWCLRKPPDVRHVLASQPQPLKRGFKDGTKSKGELVDIPGLLNNPCESFFILGVADMMCFQPRYNECFLEGCQNISRNLSHLSRVCVERQFIAQRVPSPRASCTNPGNLQKRDFPLVAFILVLRHRLCFHLFGFL